jgi:hypothetical protein
MNNHPENPAPYKNLMHSKNFAIGVLSTTAAILIVTLVIVNTRPQAVLADGMAIISGDYSISVGALTRNDEDLLYVVDNPQEMLNTYRFDNRAQEIQLVQSISLKEMRAAGTAPPKGNPQRPNRSRTKKP